FAFRVAVGLLQIHQQNSPTRTVADDLDLSRVLAPTVPPTIILLLRQLPHRLAAQLLEGPADVPHVEEELRLGRQLRRRADAHPRRRRVAEAHPPQTRFTVSAHL